MPQRHKRWKQVPGGAGGNVGDRYFDKPRPKPAGNLQAARMQEARAKIGGLEKSIKAISENPLMPEGEKNARIAKLQRKIEQIEAQNPELKRQKFLQEFAELERKKRKIIDDPYNVGLIPSEPSISKVRAIRERQVAIMTALGFDNFTEAQRAEAARFLQERRMGAAKESR